MWLEIFAPEEEILPMQKTLISWEELLEIEAKHPFTAGALPPRRPNPPRRKKSPSNGAKSRKELAVS
jgi:hypothetical protein